MFRRSGRGVRLLREVEILVVDVAELSLPGEPPRALLAAAPTTTTVLFRRRNRATSSWRTNRGGGVGGGGGCSSAGFVMRKRSTRHLGFREKHLLQKAKLKAVVLNLKYLRISDFQMWSCGSGSSCVVSRSLWSKNFVWIKIQTFGIFYGQWLGKKTGTRYNPANWIHNNLIGRWLNARLLRLSSVVLEGSGSPIRRRRRPNERCACVFTMSKHATTFSFSFFNLI